MSNVQAFITIIMCAVGTMLTRFVPFIVFPENKETPAFLTYLGKVLPYAVIGLLVIYCLKDITLFPGGTSQTAPQLIAVAFIIFLHVWKKNTLLSIGGGTVLYMVLLQYVFH